MRRGANQLYEFGPYRMDPVRDLLLRGSEPVPLTAKAFETLLVLIEHGDQVVSKEELMKKLWPDTFVEEANLAQHISMVRKALGEMPRDRRYIITLPGRGYRFAEPVYRMTRIRRGAGPCSCAAIWLAKSLQASPSFPGPVVPKIRRRNVASPWLAWYW